MNSSTKLAIISRLGSRLTTNKVEQSGFTLVELMIVVAIIGLLSAVALPQFLNARDRADAKAKVGELTGLAKECATFNAESDITTSTVKSSAFTVSCGGANPSSISITSRTWKTSLRLECLGATVSGNSARVVITPQGQMTCN